MGTSLSRYLSIFENIWFHICLSEATWLHGSPVGTSFSKYLSIFENISFHICLSEATWLHGSPVGTNFCRYLSIFDNILFRICLSKATWLHESPVGTSLSKYLSIFENILSHICLSEATWLHGSPVGTSLSKYLSIFENILSHICLSEATWLHGSPVGTSEAAEAAATGPPSPGPHPSSPALTAEMGKLKTWGRGRKKEEKKQGLHPYFLCPRRWPLVPKFLFFCVFFYIVQTISTALEQDLNLPSVSNVSRYIHAWPRQRRKQCTK